MANIRVDIDDDLHRKIRIQQAERGLTVRQAVEEALKMWVNQPGKEKHDGNPKAARRL